MKPFLALLAAAWLAATLASCTPAGVAEPTTPAERSSLNRARITQTVGEACQTAADLGDDLIARSRLGLVTLAELEQFERLTKAIDPFCLPGSLSAGGAAPLDLLRNVELMIALVESR